MITLKKAGLLGSVFICLWVPGLIGAQSPSNRIADEYLQENTVYQLVSGIHENAAPVIQSLHGRVLNQYSLDTFLLIYFTPLKKIKLSDHPEWRVYRCPLPQEELWIKRMDPSVNYINAAHHVFPGVLGQGIRASVKEYLFDTLDIDLRMAYRYSPTQLPVIQTHSTIMATLIGGRGNSAPASTGVAPELELSSSGFILPLPDTGDYYTRSNTSVQNHSYGVEINNAYSPEAYAFDLSVWKNPFLMHVFSSGNQGNESSPGGKYQGIQGYANLSGSFKMSKNTVSVGAIDSLDVLEGRSSRGPAFDGRIKPELVAFGTEGTSGAAALVTGAAALIQQAYKHDHNNELPPAALTKAILINSALDLGNPGPDYRYGYGKLNVLQALKTTTSGKYILDQLNPGQNNQHSILIPDGVKNLRFTLVWQEQPGTLFTDHALRNDLDLVVADPLSGLPVYPAVLSQYPDSDSLSRPATRGIDHVNTVEQISLDHPPAGMIRAGVSGALNDGPQNYALVYDWEVIDQMTWTFPLIKDVLKAGKVNTLRWISSFEDTVNSNLEYSLDSLKWSTIERGVDLEKGLWQWVAPDTNAMVYLRHRIGDQTYTTRSLVFGELKLQVGFICEDTVGIYWNHLKGVDRYQVFLMDQGSMKLVHETSDTFFAFKTQDPPFVAIAPVIRPFAGERNPSVNYENQGVTCYLKQFFGQKLTEFRAKLILSLGTAFNVQNIRIEQANDLGRRSLMDVLHPVQNIFMTEADLQPGDNRFFLTILLNNGKIIQDRFNLYSLGHQNAFVYPNPLRVGQSLNILTQNATSFQMLITDLQGRTIIKAIHAAGFVDLPSIPAGVYLITLWDGKKLVFKEKLVLY